MMMFLKRSMRSSLVLQLSTVALLGSACTQEKPQQAELTGVERQALGSDSKYMHGVYAEWARTHPAREMPIDLADPGQYRFVVNRLRSSGNTRENSPQLFAQLDKARAKAIAAKDSGMQTQNTAEWCGHVTPVAETTNGSTKRFTQNGLITCFGGSEYSYVDVSAYETNPAHTEFTLLSANSAEDYYLKFLESPPMDADITVSANRELYIDSMSMAFDDTRGLSHSTYATLGSAALDVAPMLTIQHPTELIGSVFPTDNPVRTCLERGSSTGNLDCDYASVNKSMTGVITPFKQPYTGLAAVNPGASATANKWVAGSYWAPANGPYDASRLYLPMQGSFSLGVHKGSACTLNSIDYSKSQADIILLEAGGRCKSTAVNANVATAGLPWTLPATNPNNLQFNGLVDFGPDCLGYQQNVKMLVTTFVRATCGNQSNFPRASTKWVYNMDFKNSCLAEGTRVLRADGTSSEVQKVQVGDKVIANERGLALTVTAFSEGIESRKMIRLRDGKGHDVLVTSKHPLITGAGAVLAAEALSVGDTVLTREGATRLTSVERVDYKGKVYNLTLGTEQELAKIGAQERTLFANGFLVGDNQMQTDLERQAHKPVDVLAQLPKSWHLDYQNDLARRSKATARQ